MKRSKAAPTAFIGDRSRFWSCSMHPSRVSSDSSGRNAFPQRAVCDPRSANDALTISQTRDAMRARSMEYENWGRRSRGYSWIDNGWSPGMARYRAGRSRAEILVAPHCARHTWPLKRCDVVFRGAASIDLFPPLAAPPRAFDGKGESMMVDSQDGANQIQHRHWDKGASDEWGSHIPTICANVSLRQSRPVIPVRKLLSCSTWL